MIVHNAWVHQAYLLFLRMFVSISAKSHPSFIWALTFGKNGILESFCLFVRVSNHHSVDVFWFCTLAIWRISSKFCIAFIAFPPQPAPLIWIEFSRRDPKMMHHFIRRGLWCTFCDIRCLICFDLVAKVIQNYVAGLSFYNLEWGQAGYLLLMKEGGGVEGQGTWEEIHSGSTGKWRIRDQAVGKSLIISS